MKTPFIERVANQISIQGGVDASHTTAAINRDVENTAGRDADYREAWRIKPAEDIRCRTPVNLCE